MVPRLALLLFKPLRPSEDMYVVFSEFVEETGDAYVLKNIVSPMLGEGGQLTFSNYVMPHEFLNAESASEVLVTVQKSELLYIAFFEKLSTHPICVEYLRYMSAPAFDEPAPEESEQK